MHDRFGKPIQKGDVVLIPAVVTELSSTEDFCNISVKSLYGRRPDGLYESFSAFNTGVVIAEASTDVSFEELRDMISDLEMAKAGHPDTTKPTAKAD